MRTLKKLVKITAVLTLLFPFPLLARDLPSQAPDLRKKDLTGKDFNGHSLSTVNFKGAILDGTSFEKADLRGCCFNKALILKANFEGAQLEGTSFKGALVTQRVYNDLKFGIPLEALRAQKPVPSVCLKDIQILEENYPALLKQLKNHLVLKKRSFKERLKRSKGALFRAQLELTLLKRSTSEKIIFLKEENARLLKDRKKLFERLEAQDPWEKKLQIEKEERAAESLVHQKAMKILQRQLKCWIACARDTKKTLEDEKKAVLSLSQTLLQRDKSIDQLLKQKDALEEELDTFSLSRVTDLSLLEAGEGLGEEDSFLTEGDEKTYKAFTTRALGEF